MAIVTPELAAIWRRIQVCLLPNLQECLDDPLTQRLKQFIAILEIVRIEEHVAAAPPDESLRGRPRQDRGPIARAFVAKAVYNLPTTDLLIEMLHLQPTLRRLCGWERRSQIPSAATFSRALAEFAHTRLGDALHAALVKKHVGRQLVLHLSRDSTEICARERAAAAPPKAEPTPPKKRGRPKKAKCARRTKRAFKSRWIRVSKRQSPSCRAGATRAPRPTPRGTGTSGSVGRRTVPG